MTYVVLGLILAAGVIAFVWLLRSRSEEAPAGGAVAASAPAAAAPAPKPTPKPAPAEDSRPAGPATESEDDEAEFTFVARRPADLAAALEAEANMESLEIDLSTAEEPPEDETGPVDRILVSAHGNSDQGRRREHNEDAYLILNGELFSIADGMGGYAAGEVASQMAVDTLTACWESGHYGDFEEDPKLPKLGDQLVRAIKSANRAIFDEASRDEAKRGMGTTIIAALFSPRKQRAYLAHVGDSRIYRYRGGKLEQLTQDHTLGALLGVSGRRGAQLTRALGIAPTSTSTSSSRPRAQRHLPALLRRSVEDGPARRARGDDGRRPGGSRRARRSSSRRPTPAAARTTSASSSCASPTWLSALARLRLAHGGEVSPHPSSSPSSLRFAPVRRLRRSAGEGSALRTDRGTPGQDARLRRRRNGCAAPLTARVPPSWSSPSSLRSRSLTCALLTAGTYPAPLSSGHSLRFAPVRRLRRSAGEGFAQPVRRSASRSVTGLLQLRLTLCGG
ncbi:MAG: serine/threonine-protein phosphatase [Sandaracinus sp.]|nr:serine/threonine-protein phosphatase [Sandaracinus sp.]